MSWMPDCTALQSRRKQLTGEAASHENAVHMSTKHCLGQIVQVLQLILREFLFSNSKKSDTYRAVLNVCCRFEFAGSALLLLTGMPSHFWLRRVLILIESEAICWVG